MKIANQLRETFKYSLAVFSEDKKKTKLRIIIRISSHWNGVADVPVNRPTLRVALKSLGHNHSNKWKVCQDYELFNRTDKEIDHRVG